jgi:hypothetical protein
MLESSRECWAHCAANVGVHTDASLGSAAHREDCTLEKTVEYNTNLPKGEEVDIWFDNTCVTVFWLGEGNYLSYKNPFGYFMWRVEESTLDDSTIGWLREKGHASIVGYYKTVKELRQGLESQW